MKSAELIVVVIVGFSLLQARGLSKAMPAVGAVNASARVVNSPEVKPDRFVDGAGGNDANDCQSVLKPCKTIRGAINRAVENDVIQVLPGAAYRENISVEKDGVTLLGAPDKAAGRPVIIGQLGSIVAVKGKNITVTGFEITNGSYIPNGENGQGSAGISIAPGSENISVSRNRIHTIGLDYQNCKGKKVCWGDSHGIKAVSYPGSGGAKAIKRVSILENTLENLHLGQSEAISMSGDVTEVLVQDNTVRNVDNIAIDFIGGGCSAGQKCQASGRIIHNEVSYVYADETKNSNAPPAGCAAPKASQYNPGQNTPPGAAVPSKDFHTMGAIYVDGAAGVVIDRNRVFCSGTGIDLGSERGNAFGGLTVTNNLVYNNFVSAIKLDTLVTDARIFNNSFVNNDRVEEPSSKDQDRGTIHFKYTEPNCPCPDLFRGVEISNNLVVDERARPLMSNFRNDKKIEATFHNNLFYSKSADRFTNHGYSFSDFKQWAHGAGNEFLTSAQFTNLFVNLGKQDFDLAKGSYAIDRGDASQFAQACAGGGCLDLLGRPRVVNKSIDAGAFEYQK